VQAGKVQDAEAAAVCRMLDQAGYAHLKVSTTRRLPTSTATRGPCPHDGEARLRRSGGGVRGAAAPRCRAARQA
jgi:hypothetical protein